MLHADSDLKKIFQEIKTIAIIGAKDKAGQPVDRVGRYLIDVGYEVHPVHPKRQSVWGIPAATELAALEKPMDAVVLFRASEYCEAHAHEVLALPVKPQIFWMQLGIFNKTAMQLMQKNGIYAIQDACIMVEHARLMGL